MAQFELKIGIIFFRPTIKPQWDANPHSLVGMATWLNLLDRLIGFVSSLKSNPVLPKDKMLSSTSKLRNCKMNSKLSVKIHSNN
jgi:hypothetical protein